MKIQYISDLHLEFEVNRSWLAENPIQPQGDVLVIAGDTGHLGSEYKKHTIWDTVSAQFDQVYIIPGNHEYYGGYDVSSTMNDFQEEIRENVWLLNNKTLELDGIQFIFSTLWSRVERNPEQIRMGMYDFKYIQYKGAALTISAYNQMFATCWAFVQQELQKKTDKKRVVVTHHMPSRYCNVKEFKGSILTEGFCTDLTDYILDAKIDAWIFGHSHRNVPSFQIGKTQMLTNQLGYVGFDEHEFFERDACFKV